MKLGIQFTPAPKNDDFENRITLRGSRTQIATSNRGATKQPGEPDHLGNSGGSSVWYSWVAPATGRVTLSTNNFPPYTPPSWTGSSGVNFTGPSCGKEIDQNPPPVFFPVFGAYTGSDINSLATANVFPLLLSDYPNAVGFEVVKGNTYQIAFDGNGGTAGDIKLYLALTKPAINDNFKKRILTHGIRVVATGFNAGATSEPGEPAPPANSNGKSVWWSWIALVSGSVSINLNGSDRAFPASVYNGSTLSNLTFVASGVSNFVFEAIQGESYQIAVNDAAGVTGATTFTLQAPVTEVPMLNMISSSSKKGLLVYPAIKKQKLLLQKSTDGLVWQDVRTGIAHKDAVSFPVKPAPDVSGPFYRAIIVDYLP